MICTYKLYVDTYWYLYHSEHPVQWIEHSLTYECPNHDSVRHVNCSWIDFSLTFIWIAMTRTDSTQDPNPVGQAEKVTVKSHEHYEK